MPDLSVFNAAGDLAVLTAAQVAAPNAEILAAVNTTYRLNVAPYTRYQSDGSNLNIASAAGLLSITNFWSLAQGFNGGASFGTTTTAADVQLNGAAGQNRRVTFYSGGTLRWAPETLNNAESGLNSGSSFLFAAYTDAGAYNGGLYQGERASGPLGTGGPYYSNMQPFVQTTPRAVVPGGVVGNDTEFTPAADAQPIATLGANPLTVTNGSPVVTVTWAGACGANGPIATTPETWVRLLGSTAVGGITPTGYLKVASIVDANTFTVTWTSNATSGASGGGAAVTVQPFFVTQSEKFLTIATTGSAGFSTGHSDYYVAVPAFYQLAGSANPTYMQNFSQIYTPKDVTATNAFATIHHEWDVINRGSDDGYAPNLYAATRPQIGQWAGPLAGNVLTSIAPDGGSGHNWNTMWSVFSSNGLVGVYDGFSVQPNALVGAALDPVTSHGGVGTDIFGSYVPLGSNPFTTATGTAVVTVSAGVGYLAAQVNTGTVYIPGTYTISGTTFGAGTYTMSNVNLGAGTFTITGSGNAAGVVAGGGTGQVLYFANLVPYAPHQVWGSFKHGITANLNSRFEDGLFIRSIIGGGVGWDDGTGIATITGTEISVGNVSVTLTPAGTGFLALAGKILSSVLQASTTYANDATAAAAGVAVGQFYRNGSVVQIRIA